MSVFRFKQFSIAHDKCAHKVGTDGVLLGAWVEAEKPTRILDIGTGSGLIALMLAQRFPSAKVTGIELDEPSACQAQENAANSPFSSRINILQGDFLNHHFLEKFDLIVSNPPFFKGNTSTGKVERDRARHEEFLPQHKFLNRAASLLSPEGKMALILPKEEAEDFITQALKVNLHAERITKVCGNAHSKDKRWLISLERNNTKLLQETFILREPDGTYSSPYRRLTSDFHIMF